jgi:probable addiction module antidote protein
MVDAVFVGSGRRCRDNTTRSASCQRGSSQDDDIRKARRIAKEWRKASNDDQDHWRSLATTAPTISSTSRPPWREADDDPAYIAQALGSITRSGNVSELARRVGMSREGLYKALSADGNPSFATIIKVVKALVLKLHFEPAA